MPKRSTQKPLEDALELTKNLLLYDSDSNSNSDLNEDLFYFNELLQKRYLAPRSFSLHHPQYKRQKLHVLPKLSFQQIFRTSLPYFLKLLEMIEGHSIFQKNSQNPQQDPAIQLAIALCRFGSNGNGAALHQLENLFTVGYGTIDLYTKRTMIAILSFQRTLLNWPDSEA